MKSKKIIGGMLAVGGLMMAAGCATVPKLTGTEKIAVVNYYLDKSIVADGAQPDPGPGLLNDKATYYTHHQEALDQAWAAFKAKEPAMIGADRCVDPSTIDGNTDMLALTAPAADNGMGVDQNLADMFLHPAGLRYVNIYDAKMDAKLSQLLKADILISIGLKANYFMSGGISIGGIGGGKMSMHLVGTLMEALPSGRILRVVELTGTSKETADAGHIGVGSGMDPKEYPRLMVSAQEDLMDKIAKEIAAW